MKLTDVIATLKAAEPTLRPHGVRHAAVFGSVARGEERVDSDIDIALDFDPIISRTIWDLVRTQNVVGELFQGPVDVIELEGLKPDMRQRVEREMVYAF
jgi:predicted nucleotidyltransferase